MEFSTEFLLDEHHSATSRTRYATNSYQRHFLETAGFETIQVGRPASNEACHIRNVVSN